MVDWLHFSTELTWIYEIFVQCIDCHRETLPPGWREAKVLERFYYLKFFLNHESTILNALCSFVL